MTDTPATPEIAEAPAQPVPTVAELEQVASALSKGAVVQKASPGRTGKQRRHLRALGHNLKPTAIIGDKGLTPGLAASLEVLLEKHELVKAKILDGSPCTTGGAALWIHSVTGADVVQVLGRTLLVYKARKKKPDITLPKG